MAKNWRHCQHRTCFSRPRSSEICVPFIFASSLSISFTKDFHRKQKLQFTRPEHGPARVRSLSTVGVPENTDRFIWEDVFMIPHSTPEDMSDLRGFLDKVALCNRNSDKVTEFVPFVVEDRIVGYVHHRFSEHLRKFGHVFIFPKDNFDGNQFGYHVALDPSLKQPADRTGAVDAVIHCLGREVIPGIRNEFYPVTSSFGSKVYFLLERAAAPYFGTKAYGVHMNGYLERDGKKYLWIGKRSEEKPTFPGMLDHLVAGGLPHGIPCVDNLAKECEEEAGIPKLISDRAISVGAVSYMDIDGFRYKRDVLFCYDLELPENFIPQNQDGEVESFTLIPLSLIGNVIKRTQYFKPNCNLVIIDFLFRHGYIKPEAPGYLKLLLSLKSGDCS